MAQTAEEDHVVRDPSLAGLLAVVVVSALVNLARAALRAHTVLAVERDRQVTARLAIWWSAGRSKPAPLPLTGNGGADSAIPGDAVAVPQDGQ